MIAIDDAPLSNPPSLLADALRFLGDRLTLIRNHERRGAMANNILAIREICDNPDALVVVVDLDDALADRDAIAIVRSHADNGHDVILAAPFRPDVPTKIYRPDFHRPRRNFGGDVWIHLRAFRKHLFDRVPDSHLQLDSRWVTNCEDYAVMMSVVELAKSPAYIADFLYWHERTTGHAPDEKANRSLIVERLLAKAELPPGHGG